MDVKQPLLFDVLPVYELRLKFDGEMPEIWTNDNQAFMTDVGPNKSENVSAPKSISS